ncbi:MAG TPA: inositol monophosphatase [Candidatus Paceibacterota bacterium]|nr:inositol monophosphatase [Candidatus Paceibacterota bacterium]
MEEFLSAAKNIAYEAGARMREGFEQGQDHTFKEDRSPITETDSAVNALVLKRLTEAFPTHRLLGEEGGRDIESSYTWVFDPIDGTAPYLRGIPTNVFSLALVKDGEPILGVVYDPHMDRLYHATQGNGAFVNETPLKTSTRTTLAYAYIAIEGYRGFKSLDFLEALRAQNTHFLTYSSVVYAHMLVASGQLEGVLFPLHNPWDAAAAKIIVEEAGGITSSGNGSSQRYDENLAGFVSAANEGVHAELIELMKPTFPLSVNESLS